MTTTEPPLRFRLYARREKSGEVFDTFLIATPESLAIWEQIAEEEPVPVSVNTLTAVFLRYGKPLEVGLDITPLIARDDEDDRPLEIELANGVPAVLLRFRFMPYGWVYPEDYLLLRIGSEEPLAAPAPLIIAALTALSKASRPR
jgi:hypothetical protein